MNNDLKFALRQLGKNPGFTFVTVLSLALGIAANTTIFSVVNALLLRPAPVASPGELWQVWRHNLKGRSVFESYYGLSYPGYIQLRDNNQSFESLAAFDPETPFVSWNHNGIGKAVQCQFVSGNFFNVSGIPAAIGRFFGPSEDRQPGADPVAVLSHNFWKNTLGGDSKVVGTSLTINGVSLTVVGVAPEGFAGLIAGLSPDFWAPYMMAPLVLHDPEWHTRTRSFSHFGVGRLKDEVDPSQAEAELTTIMLRFEKDGPDAAKDLAAAVVPSTMVPSPFRGPVRAIVAIFLGAVSMVLLIACANAANLMLARSVARRREMAVRSSMGATRTQLMRQILTESLLLALLSGVVGLLLTVWILPILLKLSPPNLPIRLTVGLDIRVLAFTGMTALATGVLFGLAPAWRGTLVNVASALKDDSLSGGIRRSRLSGALVVGQVAICLVLLIGSSLSLRSLFNAQNVKLGFGIERRLTAEVNLKDYGYTEDQMRQFNTSFLERVAALPGIKAVAIADYLPLDTRYLGLTYNVEGHEPPAQQDGYPLQTFDVGQDYFAAMGTTLLKGREFSSADGALAPKVAIINQALAEKFWPGKDPVGRRLFEGTPGQGDVYEIVGVVETGKYRSLTETSRPVVFRSRFQHPRARSTFVAYTQGDVQAALNGLRLVARDLDPRLSISRLGTLEQHLMLALFPARATASLLGVLGVVALLLAVSGLFGLIAYSVSQRTREVGIRMTLGAQRADVLRMMLRQGMRLAGAGIGIGLVLALVTTRFLSSLLFGITATDPTTFIAVPLLLLTVAALACLLPARLAAGVEPMAALRMD